MSDRGDVRRWATRLVDTAPNVAGILRSALTQQAAGAVERAGFQVSRLSYLLIPLALAVVRMCASAPQPSYSPPIVQIDRAHRRHTLATDPVSRSAFKPQLDVGLAVDKRATTCAARTGRAAVSWSAPTSRRW